MKDVEYAKFAKAVEYVFTELCAAAVCGDDEEERIFLKVVGTKSKKTASDTVKNAYSYFLVSGNEGASLVKGILSCIGEAGVLHRKKLQVWLQSEAGRLLLLDGGKFTYLVPEKCEEIFKAKEVSLLVDFREGNYASHGWIKKEKHVVFF